MTKDEAYNKISKILRVTPKVIEDIDEKMRLVSGQEGVIQDIVEANEILVSKTLQNLNLDRNVSAEDVFEGLMNRLLYLDGKLNEFLDVPNLSTMSHTCGKLCDVVADVYTPPHGLFLKKDKVVELLDKHRPENILKHFGYSSVTELVEKEGFSSVVAALRFAQSKEWMHEFFDKAYSNLKPEDFEERAVEVKVLDEKWLKVAEKMLKKKYHNLSHLKEFGVIFIIPIKIDTPGETIRLFTLLLHYLHEVPFYSGLFKKYFDDPDFNDKFKSLLRGDVPSGSIMEGGKTIVWRIIQRYLAKDNENDSRFFEPHINPEAEHWLKAESDLGRLSRMMGLGDEPMNLGYWVGLDFIGEFFTDKNGNEQLVSFDLIDLTMSLVDKGRIKYLYHQEEALWNKIFAEYMGRDTMNRLMEENIISGFIEL